MASSFAEEVYHIVRRIPKGKVSTYKAVAKALGKPQAFQAVGNALNKNLHPVRDSPPPRPFGRASPIRGKTPEVSAAPLARASNGASVSAVPCHRVVLSDGRWAAMPEERQKR